MNILNNKFVSNAMLLQRASINQIVKRDSQNEVTSVRS